MGLAGQPSIPSALEQLAADGAQRRLEHALAALPLRYREVVLLTAVEGFAAPQVAEMLGVSHAAVRQRLARGRAALKRALESE